MSNQSDAELILQVQAGSLDALGELFDRHRQLVFRTVLAITGDSEAANDLLQDVFLRLHRFIDRVDVSRPLEPWLYRMSANLAYTYMKRNKNWLRPIDDMAEWLSGPNKNQPHELVERQDDLDQIQLALKGLSLSQRVVVVLYYLMIYLCRKFQKFSIYQLVRSNLVFTMAVRHSRRNWVFEDLLIATNCQISNTKVLKW